MKETNEIIKQPISPISPIKQPISEEEKAAKRQEHKVQHGTFIKKEDGTYRWQLKTQISRFDTLLRSWYIDSETIEELPIENAPQPCVRSCQFPILFAKTVQNMDSLEEQTYWYVQYIDIKVRESETPNVVLVQSNKKWYIKDLEFGICQTVPFESSTSNIIVRKSASKRVSESEAKAIATQTSWIFGRVELDSKGQIVSYGVTC